MMETNHNDDNNNKDTTQEDGGSSQDNEIDVVVKEEVGSDNEEHNSEQIELRANYEASDMIGQESGTQTPIEDETHHDSKVGILESTDVNDEGGSDTAVVEAKTGVIQVKESEEEDSESIEIELEDDNSLLLTSLTSLFPDATGLKYRHPATNTLRGVKLADGKFVEPIDGWSAVKNYICVSTRGSKRKIEEDDDGSRKQTKSDVDSGSDLVVLGLPWSTTEDTMRSYFEQYGEVTMVQVKTDPKSGKSRGFGFVRFAKSSIQNKLLSMRHFIDGRWCDVRVPLSKAESAETKATQLSRKIFVGRLPDNITVDDLRNHFSEYGTLTDVFIPKPFRNFAFVTFGTSDMAQSIFKHKHTIKGTPVQISEAMPRDSAPSNYSGGGGGGGGGASGGFGGGPQTNIASAYGAASSYGGNVNNTIHPFNNNNYGTHQAAHHYHSKNNIGGNFGGSNMYQNNRKMHQQSTYYQMPSYGNSGPSSSIDSTGYVNHNAHNDYGNFGAAGGYNQPSGNVNGGQYYKQQQAGTNAPNQNHSTYPNQSSYSNSHGTNFSRGSYGSIWK